MSGIADLSGNGVISDMGRYHSESAQIGLYGEGAAQKITMTGSAVSSAVIDDIYPFVGIFNKGSNIVYVSTDGDAAADDDVVVGAGMDMHLALNSRVVSLLGTDTEVVNLVPVTKLP